MFCKSMVLQMFCFGEGGSLGAHQYFVLNIEGIANVQEINDNRLIKYLNKSLRSHRKSCKSSSSVCSS